MILYNVQEPRAINQDERWKEDREFCLELFNKVLRVPIKEDDLKRFVRLGRVDSIQPRKARPVFIQIRDSILKNMVMVSFGFVRFRSVSWKRATIDLRFILLLSITAV